MTPTETIYEVSDAIKMRLGMDVDEEVGDD